MTTYAQLQTDFPLWAKRTDLASMISGFVGLFEIKANRKLRTRRQETSFTGTINASSKIALPSDWAAFKSMWQENYESAPCRVQSLESVVASDRTSGTPTMYAIDGTNVRFNGAAEAVPVVGVDDLLQGGVSAGLVQQRSLLVHLVQRRLRQHAKQVAVIGRG